MKSFPSTLNESESMYGSGKATSFSASFDVERLKAINLNTSVPVIQEQLKEVNINSANFQAYPGMVDMWHNALSESSQSEDEGTVNKNYNKIYYESPYTLPAEAIALMKDYDWIYKCNIPTFVQKPGKGNTKDGKSADRVYADILASEVVPSMFNGLYGIRAKGMIDNTPLLNDIDTLGYDSNVDDCSIRTLCSLSKQVNSPLGMEKFKYADFMYCKDLGKVANNHLIVLRKFPHPVPDHIGKGTTPWMWGGDEGISWKLEGDVGRLITWFDTDDNKLEDIIKFSYGSTWKELHAEIEEKESKADDTKSGILGMIANTFNSSYSNAANNGQAGSHNLMTWLGGKMFPGVDMTSNIGSNNELLHNYDKNYKVYEPKNTIQSNHIYEGKIQFTHEFTLTFNYELRGYDNINPRSAFMDLIGNILEVTGRRGQFWGGERKLIGPPQDQSIFNTVNKLIDEGFEAIPGFIASFARGGGSFQKLLGQLGSFGQNVWGQITKTAENIVKGGTDAAKKEASGMVNELGTALGQLANVAGGKASIDTVSETVKGLLKNSLGRPQLYAWHALVSGADVGLWHVTIGNPKNPILSIGNLIMTTSSISQYGPLGLDDFPTGLKVTVSLKHPRPRDISEIGRMYTGGTTALYQHFGHTKLKNFFSFNQKVENIDDANELSKSIRSGEKSSKSDLNHTEYTSDGSKMMHNNLFEWPISNNSINNPTLISDMDRRLIRTNSYNDQMLEYMILEPA